MDDRNYSPFPSGGSWGFTHGTFPFQVAALEAIARCVCNPSNVPTTPIVATPVFSPISGDYELPFLITIICDTPDAEIHYTTDGSMPNSSSPLYDPVAGLHIIADTLIQAIGVKVGYNNSSVGSANYTVEFPQAAAPVFNPDPGAYTMPNFVLLTSDTPLAVIYYTLNGSDPTTSSLFYDPVSPILLTGDTTIKAIAVAEGYTQSTISTGLFTQLVVATPVITPPTGTFSVSQVVTITEQTSGAIAHYTTDGSDPTLSSTPYFNPFTITATTTVKAKGFKNGYINSGITSNTFTQVVPVVADPVFSPSSGSFTGTINVSITTSTSGASIYWTNDGSAPTTSSNLYTGPISTAATKTYKAIAVRSGYTNSNVVTKTYTLTVTQAATPTFSPAPSTFSTPFSLSILCATPGVTIYYTFLDNGVVPDDPTTSSLLYTGPISVSLDTRVKAFAVKAGLADSAIAAGHWVLVGTFTILWGSSTNPLMGGGEIDDGSTAEPFSAVDRTDPLANYPLQYASTSGSPPARGHWRYFIMSAGSAPPAASGGLVQSGFPLTAADLAGSGAGFTLTDSSGYPYRNVVRTADGSTYREYRFLNAINGAFTVLASQ